MPPFPSNTGLAVVPQKTWEEEVEEEEAARRGETVTAYRARGQHQGNGAGDAPKAGPDAAAHLPWASRGAMGDPGKLKHLSPRGKIWIRTDRASRSRKGKGPRFVPSMVAAALRRLCDVALQGLDPRVTALSDHAQASASRREAAQAQAMIRQMVDEPPAGLGLQAPTGDSAADLLLVLEPEEAIYLAALPDCNLPVSPLNFHRLPIPVRSAVLRAAHPRRTSFLPRPPARAPELLTPLSIARPSWLVAAEQGCQAQAPRRLSGHVIVGGDLTGLPDLVKPLRRATSTQVIVVLAPRAMLSARSTAPEARIWRSVCRRFSGLIHVDGSPLRPRDLMRAGVQRAGCVLILSSEAGSGPSAGPAAAADGGAAASLPLAARDLGALYTASAVLLFSKERERELATLLREQRQSGVSGDNARLGGIGIAEESEHPRLAELSAGLVAARAAADRMLLKRPMTKRDVLPAAAGAAGAFRTPTGAGPGRDDKSTPGGVRVRTVSPPQARSVAALQRLARAMPSSPTEVPAAPGGPSAARRASLITSAPSFAIGTSAAHQSFYAGSASPLSVSAASGPKSATAGEGGFTVGPHAGRARPTQRGSARRETDYDEEDEEEEEEEEGEEGEDVDEEALTPVVELVKGDEDGAVGPLGGGRRLGHSDSLSRAALQARQRVLPTTGAMFRAASKRSIGAKAILESSSAEGLQPQPSVFGSVDDQPASSRGDSVGSSSSQSRRGSEAFELGQHGGPGHGGPNNAGGSSGSLTGAVGPPSSGQALPQVARAQSAPSVGPGPAAPAARAGGTDHRAGERREPPEPGPVTPRRSRQSQVPDGKRRSASPGQHGRRRSSGAARVEYVARPAGSAQALVGASPRVMIELADDASIRFLSSTLQHPVVATRRRNVRAAMLRAKASELQLPAGDVDGRAAAQEIRGEIHTALEEAGMGNPDKAATARGDDGGVDESDAARLKPLFASGRVFLGAMLDSLATGLLFNPLLLRLVTQLLYGASAPGVSESRGGISDPRHAAGMAVVVRTAASPLIMDDIRRGGAHWEDESGSDEGTEDGSHGREGYGEQLRDEDGHGAPSPASARLGVTPPGRISEQHLRSLQPGGRRPASSQRHDSPAGLSPLRVQSGTSSPRAAPPSAKALPARPTLGIAAPPRTPSPHSDAPSSATRSARARTGATPGAEPSLRVNKWQFKQHDFVRQLAVPEAFHGRRCHSLFHFLVVEHRMLPLALFRSGAALGAPAPYVVTNPRPDLRVHREDRVFVLCGVEHVNPAPRELRERPVLPPRRSRRQRGGEPQRTDPSLAEPARFPPSARAHSGDSSGSGSRPAAGSHVPAMSPRTELTSLSPPKPPSGAPRAPAANTSPRTSGRMLAGVALERQRSPVGRRPSRSRGQDRDGPAAGPGVTVTWTKRLERRSLTEPALATQAPDGSGTPVAAFGEPSGPFGAESGARPPTPTSSRRIIELRGIPASDEGSSDASGSTTSSYQSHAGPHSPRAAARAAKAFLGRPGEGGGAGAFSGVDGMLEGLGVIRVDSGGQFGVRGVSPAAPVAEEVVQVGGDPGWEHSDSSGTTTSGEAGDGPEASSSEGSVAAYNEASDVPAHRSVDAAPGPAPGQWPSASTGGTSGDAGAGRARPSAAGNWSPLSSPGSRPAARGLGASSSADEDGATGGVPTSPPLGARRSSGGSQGPGGGSASPPALPAIAEESPRSAAPTLGGAAANMGSPVAAGGSSTPSSAGPQRLSWGRSGSHSSRGAPPRAVGPARAASQSMGSDGVPKEVGLQGPGAGPPERAARGLASRSGFTAVRPGHGLGEAMTVDVTAVREGGAGGKGAGLSSPAVEGRTRAGIPRGLTVTTSADAMVSPRGRAVSGDGAAWRALIEGQPRPGLTGTSDDERVLRGAGRSSDGSSGRRRPAGEGSSSVHGSSGPGSAASFAVSSVSSGEGIARADSESPAGSGAQTDEGPVSPSEAAEAASDDSRPLSGTAMASPARAQRVRVSLPTLVKKPQ